MDTYGRAFSALSDPTRRRILELITPAPLTVGKIAEALPISQPAVSQHLANLRSASLVTVQKRGRTRLYGVDEAGLVAIRSYMERTWADLLGAYQLTAKEVNDQYGPK